jgi:hypothetical protein
MAVVTGDSEQEVRNRLKKLPVLDYAGGDCIVRISSEKQAHEVANELRAWFDERPGYYKKENIDAVTAGA